MIKTLKHKAKELQIFNYPLRWSDYLHLWSVVFTLEELEELAKDTEASYIVEVELTIRELKKALTK